MKMAVVTLASAAVGLSCVALAGQARDGQRGPCDNFNGSGRIPHCGGKPGIYAFIDTVSFEPAAGEPDRIRISGTFVVPRPVSSGLHLAPQHGDLYFSLVDGRASMIRREWRELAAAAGTGEVVGFAEYWMSRPDPNRPPGTGTVNTSLVVRVRKEDDTSEPEPYPLSHEAGVITVFDSPGDLAPRFGKPSAVLIQELREAVRR